MRTNLPIDQDYSEIAIQESPVIEYTDEQVLATLADTEGWKKISTYLEERVNFYDTYLPSGKTLNDASEQELIVGWKTAVNVITEFKNLIGQVESAKSNVKARRQ